MPPEDDALSDAALWGLDEKSLQNVHLGLSRRSGTSDLGLGVWPENVDTVTAFLLVSTQWRTASAGMAGTVFLGLDYTAVRAGLDGFGLTLSPDAWIDLRVIENAALGALNESMA